MEPNTPDEHWPGWTSRLPLLPFDSIFHLDQQQSSTSSPAEYHTPLSDSYLLQAHHATRYSYDATPQRWPGEPIARRMSVSAIPHTHNDARQPALPPPRQIRFISNTGQPHTKRRRITAACLTCRKRKTRCSGERPLCNTCTDNGHKCGGYPDGAPSQAGADDEVEDEHQEDESSEAKPSRQFSPHQRSSSRPLQVPTLFQQSSADSNSAAPATNPDVSDGKSPGRSPGSTYTTNSMTSNRNRVPYFRYFGPTAIVPGFKQMVVQVRDHRRSANSLPGESPRSNTVGTTPSVVGPDRPAIDIPFYDASESAPNPPLVTHLCETFFTHIACNFPFLQRKRFLKDLEDKKVDAILVDAVCAVAARFSSDPLLSIPGDQSIPVDAENEVRRPFRGHPFAQRAMAAIVDALPCPTMAVAQACLLLAYDEFGSDKDSGLWMYLGLSIRMTQDLGIQKLEGLELEGRIGPTPKTAKSGDEGKAEEKKRSKYQGKLLAEMGRQDPAMLEEKRACEAERIDTFYAVFFLDRAVSSGLGRPVTLRDKDIEISFSHRGDDSSGWPDPFGPLLRVVHMYGRVADVLNRIKDVDEVGPEILKKLAGMERDLTGIYQRLSPKLHFNAMNFQHYVKAGQGTNFILLHFWFHSLIVLVHQPTLLHSFEGRIQQLFPDSRELSMSSAKTIADILAFAELIDVKSFIGNPFTSQPMYVAACAFLAEVAAHASQPSSRGASPPGDLSNGAAQSEMKGKSQQRGKNAAKHSLLATAANQNYQRCYQALQMLNSYWAGCRYILTALDQKSKGLMDPLLFTSEDLDGDMPSTVPSFTTPGWRRSFSSGPSISGPTSAAAINKLRAMRTEEGTSMWAPDIDHGQAIGWSLTGTTNSPAPNLSFLYQNAIVESIPGEKRVSKEQFTRRTSQITPANYPDVRSQTNFASLVGQATATQTFDASLMPPPPLDHYPHVPPTNVSTAEADLLLNLHSPYSGNSSQASLAALNNGQSMQQALPTNQNFDFGQTGPTTSPPYFDGRVHQQFAPEQQQIPQSFDDMLIESQDVDMFGSDGAFTFAGTDVIPWLEYLPQDVLSYFGERPEDHNMAMPSGPGPPPPPPPPQDRQ